MRRLITVTRHVVAYLYWLPPVSRDQQTRKQEQSRNWIQCNSLLCQRGAACNDCCLSVSFVLSLSTIAHERAYRCRPNTGAKHGQGMPSRSDEILVLTRVRTYTDLRSLSTSINTTHTRLYTINSHSTGGATAPMQQPWRNFCCEHVL